MTENNPEIRRAVNTGFTPEEYLQMPIGELIKRTIYISSHQSSETGEIIGKSRGPELCPDEVYEPK